MFPALLGLGQRATEGRHIVTEDRFACFCLMCQTPVALVIRIGCHQLRLRQAGVNDYGRHRHKETGVRGTGEAMTDQGNPRH